jgi:hypothetical protein
VKINSINWRIWAAAATVVAVGGAALASKYLSKPPDPEEIERTRRTRVNRIGRIVEGHIVELVEAAPQPPSEDGNSLLSRRKTRHIAPSQGAGPSGGQRKLVGYSYSISGVSYETAQDVTGLEERTPLNKLAAGQPASVKYDPSNPSNSILVSDDWSGLH